MASPRHRRRRAVRPQGPPANPAVQHTRPQPREEQIPIWEAQFLIPARFEPGLLRGTRRHVMKIRLPLELYEWMYAYTLATGINRTDQVYLAMEEFREKYTA